MTHISPSRTLSPTSWLARLWQWYGAFGLGKWFIRLALGVGGFMVNVSPKQAESNVAEWIEWLGAAELATAIDFPYLDTVLTLAFVALIVVTFTPWKWPVFRAAPKTPRQWSVGPAVEGSGPDWTMPELVQHVRNRCIDVAPGISQIEDKARLEQLKFWGRKYSAASPHENPNPQRPIPADHWDHYCLNATRCAYAEDPSTCCTEPRSNNDLEHNWTDSFQDLRVNKAQAMALWPSSGGNDVEG